MKTIKNYCQLLLSALILLCGSPYANAASNELTKFFLSGHSLTDNPLPDYIVAITKSKGQSSTWKQQIVIGSPLRWRTRGDAADGSDKWPGYGYSKENLPPNTGNVLDEFAQASKSKPYDALIVAEGHETVASIIWNDTVRYLRHFHENFIKHNPAGQTYFFSSWEAIKDKSKPEPWLRLEKAATPVWACVVNRVNMSLAHEKRTDRIKIIAANAAVSELVNKAIQGQVAGISGASKAEIIDLIIKDDVHLTQLGAYYLALFSYATVTGESPEGAWHPGQISAQQAKSLQKVAWSVHKSLEAKPLTLTLPECRRMMTESFCDMWNAYVPNKSETPQEGCKSFFAQTNYKLGDETINPFTFMPDQEARYWYPAPPTASDRD